MAQARRRPGLSRAAALALGAMLAIACGSCGARHDDLVERFPTLRSIDGQRLADANPYPLPLAGRLTFFLCRWPTELPIPIVLPSDASAGERRAIETALHAWEGAGLGLRFAETLGTEAGIDIGFVAGTVDTAAGQDTANTIVDCRIAPASRQGGAGVAGAELVRARIRIARITNPDTQGHQRPLTAAELTGTALHAWEGAGLGLRFAEAVSAEAGIEIGFVTGTVDTAAGQDTASTVVDCRIAPASQQSGAGVDRAELVRARIRIARITNQDTQGHQRPLSAAELSGTALHELGHALGFQGHARHGDTVMVRETERIAHAGKGLLAGDGFRDPSLRALYALPSGAVVASAPVDRCRTDLVDRMARVAEENHLDGPFVRVGESAGRIFWRDDKGTDYGLVIAKVREALRDPAKLLVVPESRVRGSLARVHDVPCTRAP